MVVNGTVSLKTLVVYAGGRDCLIQDRSHCYFIVPHLEKTNETQNLEPRKINLLLGVRVEELSSFFSIVIFTFLS